MTTVICKGARLYIVRILRHKPVFFQPGMLVALFCLNNLGFYAKYVHRYASLVVVVVILYNFLKKVEILKAKRKEKKNGSINLAYNAKYWRGIENVDWVGWPVGLMVMVCYGEFMKPNIFFFLFCYLYSAKPPHHLHLCVNIIIIMKTAATTGLSASS